MTRERNAIGVEGVGRNAAGEVGEKRPGKQSLFDVALTGARSVLPRLARGFGERHWTHLRERPVVGITSAMRERINRAEAVIDPPARRSSAVRATRRVAERTTATRSPRGAPTLAGATLARRAGAVPTRGRTVDDPTIVCIAFVPTGASARGGEVCRPPQSDLNRVGLERDADTSAAFRTFSRDEQSGTGQFWINRKAKCFHQCNRRC